jgi:hypothetical protein
MSIIVFFMLSKPYTPPHSAPACSNPVKCQSYVRQPTRMQRVGNLSGKR